MISAGLPYDAARFGNADAILLSYLGAGLDMSLTVHVTEDDPGGQAYNANVFAAFEAAFGGFKPTGMLPVNIPAIEKAPDGSLCFSSEILYERGFGLIN